MEDDWEVKEEEITITLSQFNSSWDNRKLSALKGDHIRDSIARNLGFDLKD